MNIFSPIWLEILSELFVNLAAGWFGVVFVEQNIKPISSFGDVFILTFKTGLGILSLTLAKKFREDAKK